MVEPTPWTETAIQSEIAAIHLRYRRDSQINPAYDIPHLTLMYDIVSQTQQLSHPRRVAMQQMLEERLLTLDERLQRDIARLKRDDRLSRNRLQKIQSRSTPRDGDKQLSVEIEQQLAGGAAEFARAMELVELIQLTVDPEGWDVNGGRGTIRYFSNLRVLVIRTTGHNHEEVSGTLGVLGHMQR